MKKMKFMRIAAVMLILCLASTCAISGTFAKYTTSGTATDSARVAAFGVTVEATGDATFSPEYTSNVASDGNANAEVKASAKVVAPGTEGTMATINITGTPEVAVKVSYTADLALAGWTVDTDTYYCPIEIKVGDTTLKGTTYASMAEFETAVENAVKAYSANYKPSTDLSGATEPSISWKWAFEGNDDEKDTKLGNANSATIAFTLNVEVTQIDSYTA